MTKPTFESLLISRITKIAPSLKFTGQYRAAEEFVTSCMLCYKNRSFVYVLTSIIRNKEYCIYVGQTSLQSARFASHIKKTEFTRIYLFECDKNDLNSSERLIIEELKPIYNLKNNPCAVRYKDIIKIDYSTYKDFEKIQKDIQMKEKYETIGLYGFALSSSIYSFLKTKSVENNCTCSEVLQQILENIFTADISKEFQSNSENKQTNLTTINNYAESHRHSRESIKQFLNGNPHRIPGAQKLGRDWILPFDAPFPSDKRKKD